MSVFYFWFNKKRSDLYTGQIFFIKRIKKMLCFIKKLIILSIRFKHKSPADTFCVRKAVYPEATKLNC